MKWTYLPLDENRIPSGMAWIQYTWLLQWPLSEEAFKEAGC